MSYLPQGVAKIEVNCMALVVRPYCAMLLQIPESEVKIYILNAKKGCLLQLLPPYLVSRCVCPSVRWLSAAPSLSRRRHHVGLGMGGLPVLLRHIVKSIYSTLFKKRNQTILSCFFN